MAIVLVGYDGSAPSSKALEYAALRARRSGDTLHVVTVVPEGLDRSFLTTMLLPNLDLSTLTRSSSIVENARRKLEEAVAPYRKMGVEVQTEVRTGMGAEALIEAAGEVGASEIVLGHKSYESVENLTLGSVVEKVVRYAPVTVTVVR